MSGELNIMIMSGVDDGSVMRCSAVNGDGMKEGNTWVLAVGRHDNNDICLNNDTFVSRYHARIHVKGDDCWLEDQESTNGSYIEISDGDDEQVLTRIQLSPGQLFRVGRTWLRIESYE